MSSRRLAVALVSLASLSALGCSLWDKIIGKNGKEDDLDPVAAENYLQRNFTHIPHINEALARVVATVNGSPQSGVSFVPITGGVQGTVGVDLDGNGVQETTVAATIIFTNPAVGISGGGELTVTAINAASTSGTASAHLAMQGTSTVIVSNGVATLHPTEGPSTITISNGNLSVTASQTNPLILGSADFAAGSTTGTTTFESNGAGSYRIRVSGSNFTTFTVP